MPTIAQRPFQLQTRFSSRSFFTPKPLATLELILPELKEDDSGFLIQFLCGDHHSLEESKPIQVTQVKSFANVQAEELEHPNYHQIDGITLTYGSNGGDSDHKVLKEIERFCSWNEASCLDAFRGDLLRIEAGFSRLPKSLPDITSSIIEKANNRTLEDPHHCSHNRDQPRRRNIDLTTSGLDGFMKTKGHDPTHGELMRMKTASWSCPTSLAHLELSVQSP